jgi:hypothetical protein
MLFRVQCVDKATGAQGERLYHAETADRAAELALREGYIVGHVYPEPDLPPAPPPPKAGGRLTGYGAKPPKRTGLMGFLTFDVLVYPMFIRYGFLILTVLAVLYSISMPILWLLLEKEKQSRESALELLYSLAITWGMWLAFRLASEWLILLFTIREELIELNSSTRPRG